jgi:PhnB protein
MHIHTYLLFDGTCGEAFRLYERVLGGKIDFIQTHGESPMKDQTPPDFLDKVMHVHMTVGDQVLMGSDAPPGHFKQPQGFSVSLGVTDPAEAERVFNGLAEGGTVSMPLQKTFWSESFGMLVDRYGTPWMVNCQQGS